MVMRTILLRICFFILLVEQREKSLDIGFVDLAGKYSNDKLAGKRFNYSVEYDGRRIVKCDVNAPVIGLSLSTVRKIRDASKGADFNKPESHLYCVEIISENSEGKKTHPVDLWLWYEPADVTFQLVSIVHED